MLVMAQCSSCRKTFCDAAVCSQMIANCAHLTCPRPVCTARRCSSLRTCDRCSVSELVCRDHENFPSDRQCHYCKKYICDVCEDEPLSNWWVKIMSAFVRTYVPTRVHASPSQLINHLPGTQQRVRFQSMRVLHRR